MNKPLNKQLRAQFYRGNAPVFALAVFAALADCLSGFTLVKTFKAEKEIFRLFAENNRALEQEKFSRRKLKVMVGMIGSVAGVVAQLGVFLVGAWLAVTGRGLTARTAAACPAARSSASPSPAVC